MKKVLVLLVIAAVLLGTFATISLASGTEEASALLQPGEGAAALDGKSIIFVGSDYTFKGGVVERTSAADTNCTYAKRTADPGYFKRLAKAAGATVTVVDWAFPSHKLSNIFSEGCTLTNTGHTSGRSHLDDLTNKSFDYVVLQGTNEGYTTAEEYRDLVKSMAAIFREANPNVKILYAVPNAAYTSWSKAFRDSLSLIKNEGITIVDWGALVTDVYMGRTEVPGATEEYNKNSFIISTSSTSTYPNLLSGYLYAQMVWCAITGETAVGQSYDFALNYTGTYSISTFSSDNYTYDNPSTADVNEASTNLGKIFNSKADMQGLQKLCDEYLTKETWNKQVVTFLDDDGTVISSAEYSIGEKITIPEAPTKSADENFGYVFAGWDKTVSETCEGSATYTATYKTELLKDWGTFAPGSNAAALNGKKILFTGCSYTYYGGIIERSGVDQFSQATRTTGENGYFKKLCKHYGIDVTVTDWVFGGHDLSDIFDGSCASGDHDGHDHLADLTDRNYDIVILQEILNPNYTTGKQYYDGVKEIMDLFLAENPDTQFYYYSQERVYSQASYNNEWKKHLQMLAEDGVTIIDWGAVVYDVMNGNVEVPGSELEYNKQSFVVSNSASDGYHQTLLAGYIGLVMTWSHLTGETPIGQPIDIVRNATGKYLGIDDFIKAHFVYDNPNTEVDERVTNMDEALRSDVEVLGFQKVAADYLFKTRWLDFIEYEIEFRDDDGTLLKSELLKYGQTVTPPTAPSKAQDTNYTYTFIDWDKEVVACEGDCVYTAVYSKTRREYQVTFLDDDGSLLLSTTCYGGVIPTPPTVADKNDGTYRYIFDGWDKDITACEGDVTYTAQYIKLSNGIIVTFVDYDGRVISAQSYTIGESITVPDNPKREADNTFNYTFAGWDKDINYTPTTDTTYTATYTGAYIDYTVIFKDEDGTVISEATYHYGDEVVIPESPSKTANETYTYTFSGWGGTVNETCQGNATYTASYTANYIVYSITFFDEDGEVILTKTYHWGDAITIPEPPIKEADTPLIHRYDASWDKDVSVTCQGSTSYNVVYTLVYIEYEVVFMNEDGSIISSKLYHYGDEIEIPESPTKASDGAYEYSFIGWGKAIGSCIGDAEYTAQFEATPISGAPDDTPEGGESTKPDDAPEGGESTNPDDNEAPALGLVIGISAASGAVIGGGALALIWFILKKKRPL